MDITRAGRVCSGRGGAARGGRGGGGGGGGVVAKNLNLYYKMERTRNAMARCSYLRSASCSSLPVSRGRCTMHS